MPTRELLIIVNPHRYYSYGCAAKLTRPLLPVRIGVMGGLLVASVAASGPWSAAPPAVDGLELSTSTLPGPRARRPFLVLLEPEPPRPLLLRRDCLLLLLLLLLLLPLAAVAPAPAPAPPPVRRPFERAVEDFLWPLLLLLLLMLWLLLLLLLLLLPVESVVPSSGGTRWWRLGEVASKLWLGVSCPGRCFVDSSSLICPGGAVLERFSFPATSKAGQTVNELGV